jgi:hypothetical protein
MLEELTFGPDRQNCWTTVERGGSSTAEWATDAVSDDAVTPSSTPSMIGIPRSTPCQPSTGSGNHIDSPETLATTNSASNRGLDQV